MSNIEGGGGHGDYGPRRSAGQGGPGLGQFSSSETTAPAPTAALVLPYDPTPTERHAAIRAWLATIRGPGKAKLDYDPLRNAHSAYGYDDLAQTVMRQSMALQNYAIQHHPLSNHPFTLGWLFGAR